jgi:hypothetical protein
MLVPRFQSALHHIELLPMMDYSHFEGNMVGEQPWGMVTGENLTLDNAPAIERELMVQSHIQAQQLLSPTQYYQHKRQDSFFSNSPSSGSMSSRPSPHQAEAQPCLSGTSSTQQAQMPQAANMMRSASQRSQWSTGSHQKGRYGQHRASIGFDPEFGAVNMSRSSTNHSRASLGHQLSQVAPQSYAAHTQHAPSGFSSWTTGHTIPTTPAVDTNCGLGSSMTNFADTTFGFGADDIHEKRAVELDGVGEIFGQGNNTNEVFGQEPATNK